MIHGYFYLLENNMTEENKSEDWFIEHCEDLGYCEEA